MIQRRIETNSNDHYRSSQSATSTEQPNKSMNLQNKQKETIASNNSTPRINKTKEEIKQQMIVKELVPQAFDSDKVRKNSEVKGGSNLSQ